MSNADADSIKPCPFCGSVGLDFREGSTFRWLIAECACCRATCGEVRVQTTGDGNPDLWAQQARQDAIKAWNERAAQPDDDPNGECETKISRLHDMVHWAYSKLHMREFRDIGDALKLDEMKLILEHGI